MCLILDTNRFSLVLGMQPDAALRPLIVWLTGPDGMLVYGGTKYGVEIARNGAALAFFAELERVGKAHPCDTSAIDAEAARLRTGGSCKSDDEHLVALARIGGARVVCTNDKALMRDVRNPDLVKKPRGRVYQRAEHVHLLHHDPGCKRRSASKKPPGRDRV